MPWFLYMIECSDGSIYTGVAVDVDKRFAQHCAGKGAKYTRSHPPKELLVQVRYPDRSAAQKAEHRMKQLSAREKWSFCRARAAKKKAALNRAKSIRKQP